MPRDNDPLGDTAQMAFPLGGIDAEQPFDLQPVGTAPDALNVCAVDPTSNRARGGSRPGLGRFLPALPTHGTIQHLQIIVDPQADALTADFGELPFGSLIQFEWIDDPTTGLNRYGVHRNLGQVHRRGSGRETGFNIRKSPTKINWDDPSDMTTGEPLSATQLNAVAVEAPGGVIAVAGTFEYSPAAGTVLSTGKATLKVKFTPTDQGFYKGCIGQANVNVGLGASPNPQFVQGSSKRSDSGDPAITNIGNTFTPLQFDPFTVGNLLVAIVIVKDTFTLALGALTDTFSNIWAFASASPAHAHGAKIYIWYCRCNATGDIDFSLNYGAMPGTAVFSIWEYKNIAASLQVNEAKPGDGTEILGNPAASPYKLNTFPLAKRSQHDLYLGIFGGIVTTALGDELAIPGSGYTSRGENNIASTSEKAVLFIEQAVNPVLDGGIYKITLTNGGSGYSAPPVISFTGGGGGSGAAATAVMAGDVVASVTVTASGSGYTSLPNVVFTGDGVGAAAVANSTVTPTCTKRWNADSGLDVSVTYGICFKQA